MRVTSFVLSRSSRTARSFHQWAVALLATCSAVAAGQEPSVLAQRAAEADAFRKLAEVVYGLAIDSTTSVRDLATESDEVRAAVDAFVHSVKLHPPQVLPDGSCQVEAEVSLDVVAANLRQAIAVAEVAPVSTEQVDALAREQPNRILRVRGEGVPRTDLPASLSRIAMQRVAGNSRGSMAATIPPNWTALPPQARLLAQGAARKDAQRRLAERILGVRVRVETRVRDFAIERENLETEMSGYLAGATEVRSYLRDQEYVAEVTMRLSANQVAAVIRKLFPPNSPDLPELMQGVARDMEETGLGVPPQQFLTPALHQVRAPEWVALTLEAEGRGVDPEFDTPQGKLRALRAAEADARRRLAEQIAALPIADGAPVRVSQKLEADGITKTQLDAVLADVAVISTRLSGGEALIKVTVPGVRVWGALDVTPAGSGATP